MMGLINSFDSIYIFLLLLVILGGVIAMTTEFVVITIYFSIFSFLSAITYLLLGAADVAITEAAVGAALSTIFILAALDKIGDKDSSEAKIQTIRSIILQQPFKIIAAILPVLLIIYALPDLPQFGFKQILGEQNIAQYYLENSGYEIGIKSVVTSILASYRSFDTMLESLVIFTSAIGVYSISQMAKK